MADPVKPPRGNWRPVDGAPISTDYAVWLSRRVSISGTIFSDPRTPATLEELRRMTAGELLVVRQHDGREATLDRRSGPWAVRKNDGDEAMVREVEQLVAALNGRPRPKPGGPPPDPDAVTLDRIRDALVAWSGEWPPTQEPFAQEAFRREGRTVRLVLNKNRTSWENELARAERLRP